MNAEPVIAVDLTAIPLDAAGLPQDRVPDGRGIVPLLAGKGDSSWRERPMTWHFPFYSRKPVTTPPARKSASTISPSPAASRTRRTASAT